MPRLLDLFCGAGGSAVGYHQAGFDEIVGVDINPQPNYPFMFIQGDALAPPVRLQDFDLIHASPPCQAHVPMAANRWDNPRWPDLIPPTRGLVQASGVPYVIENVVGASKSLKHPMMLTGEMFGLVTSRPRLFELGGWFAMSPPKMRRQEKAMAIYGKPDGRRLTNRKDGTDLHAWTSMEAGAGAMGIDWMTNELEIREAIPPAYTKFIGEQFLAQTRCAEPSPETRVRCVLPPTAESHNAGHESAYVNNGRAVWASDGGEWWRG